MEGTYEIYGTTLTNPTVEYYFVGWNYVVQKAHVDINVTDGTENVPMTYNPDDVPTNWDDQATIEIWVENYLQQYRTA